MNSLALRIGYTTLAEYDFRCLFPNMQAIESVSSLGSFPYSVFSWCTDLQHVQNELAAQLISDWKWLKEISVRNTSRCNNVNLLEWSNVSSWWGHGAHYLHLHNSQVKHKLNIFQLIIYFTESQKQLFAWIIRMCLFAIWIKIMYLKVL